MVTLDASEQARESMVGEGESVPHDPNVPTERREAVRERACFSMRISCSMAAESQTVRAVRGAPRSTGAKTRPEPSLRLAGRS